jgi:sporulation protein YlmC with PRC-barrel domain
MKITSIVLAALGILAFAGFASAQQPAVTPLPSAAASKMTEILASVSAESLTITTWYKQNVYDMANKKIGDISDVLVSPSDGKITAVVIGVGGFLGVGEKDDRGDPDEFRSRAVNRDPRLKGEGPYCVG